MKFLTETPWDHLMVMCLLIVGGIYAVWALLFESDKEPDTREHEYFVEGARTSLRNPAILLLWVVTLIIASLLAYYIVDNAISPKLK